MENDNKVTLKEKWFDDIRNDPNLEDVTEQKIAYIIYAAVKYGFSSEKINIGKVFGKEFKDLNMAMPNIYGQIDRIKNYDPKNGTVKYDSEAIKELRLQGLKAKEICEELGYPVEKAKSLTSNKGWIEAGKLLKENPDLYRTVQKDTNVSIQKQKTESVQNDTESVQKTGKLFEF